MIRNNLICVAAMAVALAAPALAETSREASERVLPADGIKGVRVVNSRGRVILKPSADGRLHLKALKILRGTAAERKRLSAETAPTAAPRRACEVDNDPPTLRRGSRSPW